MTRVVIASRLYAPEPAAAASQLAVLAGALVVAGADVEVLTTRPPRGTPVPAGRSGRGRSGAGRGAAGERVRRWPVLRDRSGRVRGYVQYASYDVPLALRLLLARRPDVVVVQPPPTTGGVVRVVAALRRVPYVYYADDVLTEAAAGAGVAGPVLALLRALEEFALRGAARVLTVSDQVAEVLVGYGVARADVEVVGTGVDTAVLTPTDTAATADPAAPTDPAAATDLAAATDRETPADPGPPAATAPRVPPLRVLESHVPESRVPDGDAGPVLVYAGTMSEVHGAGVFVEAFARAAARVPGARLVMLGDGSERPALQRRAQQLRPGAVAFPGQVPVADVARWMRRAAAGLASVRPGSGYEFAFATKMFAATACGAPVVFAGVGPCVAIIGEHRLGWAAAWEEKAVAEAMVAALTAPRDEAERARIAAVTRSLYSLDAVAARAVPAVLAAARR